MRKKVFFLVTVIISSLMLVACGSQLNDNNTRAAKSIIKTVDSYLDGDMDAATAHEKVYEEYNNVDDSDENSTGALSLSTNALVISSALSAMDYDGGGDVSEIKECRNEIAELIGEKKYK